MTIWETTRRTVSEERFKVLRPQQSSIIIVTPQTCSFSQGAPVLRSVHIIAATELLLLLISVPDPSRSMACQMLYQSADASWILGLRNNPSMLILDDPVRPIMNMAPQLIQSFLCNIFQISAAQVCACVFVLHQYAGLSP